MANINIDVDVDVDIIDYIDEIETDDLLGELKNRCAIPTDIKQVILHELDGTELRDHLADIVQVGAHVSVEDILNKLREKI